MVVVSGKALGGVKSLFEAFSVLPPDEMSEGGATLRALIECVVRHGVEAFRERQSARQFVQVMTAKEIETCVESGKIDAGGSEIEPQKVDADEAVATALQAFEDGIYIVVIDEKEQRDLDAEIFLQPDSRMTFVRLALLAGG